MRAARWTGPETLELHEREEPVAGPGQAIVEVAACGICGSDLQSFRTGFAATPGQVLGHEFSGTVVSAPGVSGLEVGTRVAVRPLMPCGRCPPCRAGELQLCEAGHERNIGYAVPGAFAERVCVPTAVVGQTIFPLGDAVDAHAGALVEPLAVGLRAVDHCGDVAGRTVVVLGAGTIGLAATRFLRLRGAGTIAVADLSERRRRAARQLGADTTIDPGAESTVDAVRAITGPGLMGRGARADAVIDCAGAPGAFSDAVKLLRGGGTLVLAATHGRRIELAPDRLVEKELVVRGSFGYRDEFPAVIGALAAGQVDPAAFVSHVFGLSEIAAAFRTGVDREASLKVLVEPQA